MDTFFYIPIEHAPHIHNPQSSFEPEVIAHDHSRYIGTSENWIYQSWSRLTKAGINVKFSSNLPPVGIILSQGSYFGKKFSFFSETCFIDMVVDGAPHPAAHAYLVQNRIQQKYIPHSFFIPHWPQPKMIPRSPNRGNIFENIAFFGNPSNLAPELQNQEWHNYLRRTLGLSFTIKSPNQWHDYSEVDAVIAIRSFSQSRYLSKSALKLYNAWLAGVPLIGGRDIAYADEGNSGKDYLLATSLEELFLHLRRLKEDPSFRQSLVSHGHYQGSFYTQQKTTERWRLFIKETIPKLARTQVRKTPRQRLLMRQQHRFFSWAYQQRNRLLNHCKV